MHSWIGPWNEANFLYIDQSRFTELCKEPGSHCVLYDIGLGTAANSLAAVERYRSEGCKGRLTIISFENDLDGLASAIEHRADFDFVARNVPILEALLKNREWREGEIEWRLLEGDFRETLKSAPAPDVVFWDFYDPKSCPDLWTPAIFRMLREHCTKPARVFTYSASTPTRLAMVLSGFYAGYGRQTPVKADTSIAATEPGMLERPLGEKWIAKLRRSTKPWPYGEEPSPLEAVIARVMQSPQFRKG